MGLMILFGAGFVGVLVVLVGFLNMAIRKVSEPSNEWKERVERLEKDLHAMKH